MADRTNNSTTAAILAQGGKTVQTAGTPVPLVATRTLVECVHIQARRSRSVANSNVVYIGFQGGAGNQHKTLSPGDTWDLAAPVGKKIDLAGIFIDATTNSDGVVYSTMN